MKKINLFLVSLVTLVALSFSSCGGSSVNHNTQQAKISSIEDAKSFLNGKTFIATPSGDLWYKLQFSGGTASLWKALPQDGRWGSADLSVSYEVKQDRYADTGQTYFYVMLGSSDSFANYFKFDITRKKLYYGLGGTGTTMQEGDRNPWN